MHTVSYRRFIRTFGFALALALLCALSQAQDAATLTARHATLREALKNNAFQRPLVLESTESSDALRGDIYARIDQPMGVVGLALQDAGHWCDILILHLNVKQCRSFGAAGSARLALAIGSKHDQPLADAYRFEFTHQVVTSQPGYLQVQMKADQGPMGTRDYRITLEVVALETGSSFLHLSYAYGYGITARMAMQLYLSTVGRNKVGFSIIGKQPDGRPVYIAGTRGVVERNTMRYYLAIQAYLGALSLPPAQQFEQRLAEWYAGVERYPLQLHELERADYLGMKREQVKHPPMAAQ